MARELVMAPASPEELAFALADLGLPDLLVVALPGGMATASRIARTLEAPFDVLVARGAAEASSLDAHSAERHYYDGGLRLKGRSVVLTDDGDADIAAWAAALRALRAMRPAFLVIAVPRLEPGVARWLSTQFEHVAGPLVALA